ncbi:acyl-CoA/acyl-ACP dehydrogenase [Entomomonas sp. E2T0]|uniref:acyl-CoA dehydrogenase family protein n=1 Tax=Entomomonas sp. E2T0 TaxID=2930213 RepID=UPI0022281C2A|nr:acyl-CoA dehydrogenase family protein [Entomomonas sp. E2T0]UYZ84932.1 acyl-CoA/acyl-ACP dehydrogenase [Entomomonas sp. E2T0]
MTKIINELKNNINKYLDITPLELKELLLKTNATAQCLELNADNDINSLETVGNTIREASSLLPSVGIALTMHNHILLACKKYSDVFIDNEKILKGVLDSKILLASAFAEAIPGANIFSPSVQIFSQDERLLVSGSKKPCTLSSIADYYVISVKDIDACEKMKLLLIDRNTKNIEITPFSQLNLLKECDNQEVKFNNAEVTHDLVSKYQDIALLPVLSYGLSLFNYFAANAYAGALEGLINFLPQYIRQQDTIKYRITQNKYRVYGLLKQMLSIAYSSYQDENAIPKILALRYILEEILEHMASYIVRCCGGIQAMTNPKIFEFYSIIQLFKFHPTSEYQTVSQLMKD